MGRMTLHEVVKSHKLNEGAKATKKGKQPGKLTCGTGKHVACRTRLGGTQKVNVKMGKAKAGTMNDNRRQRLATRLNHRERKLPQEEKATNQRSNRRLQKKIHTMCPRAGGHFGELMGKSTNWFRFQDADWKVNQLSLLRKESSRARRRGTH